MQGRSNPEFIKNISAIESGELRQELHEVVTAAGVRELARDLTASDHDPLVIQLAVIKFFHGYCFVSSEYGDTVPAEAFWTMPEVFLYFIDINKAKANAPSSLKAAIASQDAFLSSLGQDKNKMLMDVRNNSVRRYPQVKDSTSGLKSFPQFLVWLMADALAQLNELLQTEQNQHFHSDVATRDLVARIIDMASGSKYQEYRPSAADIAALHATENISHFLGKLTKNGVLKFKATEPEEARSDDESEQSYISGVNNESHALINTAPLTQENTALAYPFPAYLAKSFMYHLADTLDEASSEMSEIAEELRKQPSKAAKTLSDIYKIEFEEEQLQAILMPQPDNFLSRTLIKAGLAFLAENPSSLMRRYVFLTQLKATVDFGADSQPNEAAYTIHLAATVNKMRALRYAMKTLYPANSSSVVSSAVIIDCMNVLIKLAKQSPDIAVLARVLLIACLDKLDQEAFVALPQAIRDSIFKNTPLWPTEKENFIQALAQDIGKDANVKKLGIRPWVTALLETTYFQQGRYRTVFMTKPYSHEEHQAKIQPALIHLGACVDVYFEKPVPKEVNTSALVLDIFPTVSEPLENEEISVSGANKAVHKTRLRLSTNLQPYWQAALAWGLNADSITATTLAIVNSRNEAALQKWNEALQAATLQTPSAEVQVNAWLVNSTLIKSEDNYENAQLALDKKKLNAHFEEECLAHYQAVVVFAQTLLSHIKHEQVHSSTDNETLSQLCVVVHAYISALYSTIAAERTALDHFQSRVDAASFLRTLEEDIESFLSKFIQVCYSTELEDGTLVQAISSNSIIAIRTQVYGANVSDPKAGLAFDFALNQAINIQNDRFFIDAMFTLRANRLPRERVSEVCLKIADSYEHGSVLSRTWAELESHFYGNSSALNALFHFYISENRTEASYQENVEKALKIAIFGFSNNAFSDEDKVIFAQKVLIAFSKLTQSAENLVARSEKHKVLFAFKLLADTPHLVSVEERAAIEVLKSKEVAKQAGEKAEDDFDTLNLHAQEQAVVYNKDRETVMGVKVSYEAYKTKYVEDLETHVTNFRHSMRRSMPARQSTRMSGSLNAAQQAAALNTAVSTPLEQRDALLAVLVQTAFPKNLRYYASKPGSDNLGAMKYERDDESIPDPLIKVLWEQIVAVKKELNAKEVDSVVVVTALNDLRGVTRTAKGVPGQWQVVLPQTLLYIYPRANGNWSGTETAQRAGRVDPLKLELIVAQTQKFGAKNQTLPFFAKSLHNLVLETNGAWLLDVRPEDESVPLRTSDEGVYSPLPATASASADEEEIQAAYKKHIEKLVLETVEILLKEAPTPEYFSGENTSALAGKINQSCINEYRNKLMDLSNENAFKRRIRFISNKEYEKCMSHIFYHRREQGGEKLNQYAELSAFVLELKNKIESSQGEEAKLYQQYSDNFIWFIAEKGALEQAASSEGQDGPQPNDYLDVLKQNGFDWDYLIALGAKQYAAMDFEGELSQDSFKMVKALAQLASPLSYVFLHQSSELSGVVKKLQKRLNDCRRGTYEKFDQWLKTNPLNRLENWYYNIYTLAQAYAFDGEEYAPTSSKAKNLLALLQKNLLSDKKFLEWRPESLDITKGSISFLYTLVYRQLPKNNFASLIMSPQHKDQDTVKNQIQGHYWERCYFNMKPSYDAQYSYEASVAYALERILSQPEIRDDKVQIHGKDKGSFQHATMLEQQSLAFMAAKYFYNAPIARRVDNQLQRDNYGNVIREKSPFDRAIKIVADGRGATKEAILNELLKKACDSLHIMLDPGYTDQYHLDNALKIVMKEDNMKWVSDTPQILEMYVERALKKGIQSKEQVDFILTLLKPKEIAPGYQESDTSSVLSSSSAITQEKVEDPFSTPARGGAISQINSATSRSGSGDLNASAAFGYSAVKGSNSSEFFDRNVMRRKSPEFGTPFASDMPGSPAEYNEETKSEHSVHSNHEENVDESAVVNQENNSGLYNSDTDRQRLLLATFQWIHDHIAEMSPTTQSFMPFFSGNKATPYWQVLLGKATEQAHNFDGASEKLRNEFFDWVVKTVVKSIGKTKDQIVEEHHPAALKLKGLCKKLSSLSDHDATSHGPVPMTVVFV